MVELEDYLLMDPEQVRMAHELRRRVRRLAHLGFWPTHLEMALTALLPGAAYYVTSRLPIPDTVGPVGIVLFMLIMLLALGVFYWLHKAVDVRLRRALGLETWPKPRGDITLARLTLGGVALAFAFLVHYWLGIGDRFDLILLLVAGLTQLAAAYETQVSRYAVEGTGLLWAWVLLVTLSGERSEALTFLGIALIEFLTAIYGWREWSHVQEVDTRV